MGTLTINASVMLATVECDTGKVSDGYHTFDELYDHRCLLFLMFLEMNRSEPPSPNSTMWKSRKHSDGEAWEGWFIAGVELKGQPITYHIPDKYWDLCRVEERETAPVWDGHTSGDVITRLIGWLEQ